MASVTPRGSLVSIRCVNAASSASWKTSETASPSGSGSLVAAKPGCRTMTSSPSFGLTNTGSGGGSLTVSTRKVR